MHILHLHRFANNPIICKQSNNLQLCNFSPKISIQELVVEHILSAGIKVKFSPIMLVKQGSTLLSCVKDRSADKIEDLKKSSK